MTKCPCGSKRAFSACCQPYIHNIKKAPTAEALMRSRYTAYTMADIDYIIATMHGKAAENFDAVAAKNWAESITWLGLTIIHSDRLTVTFIAKFSDPHHQVLFEKSEFEQVNGKWFYINGKTPDISRNSPCPCHSGKKTKRCCFP